MVVLPFDKKGKTKEPNLVSEIMAMFRRRYVLCAKCDSITFNYIDEDGRLTLRCSICDSVIG